MDLVSELQVSPQYLRDAIEIEMQKNDDPKQAAIIAIRRIKEDANYYQENFGIINNLEMVKAKGAERSGHKYIKRVPDGKGGWNYIYREDLNKKKNVIEEIKRKKTFHDYMNQKINFDKDIKGKFVVGYRYGKAPSGERSYNHRDNKYEAGLSMAKIGHMDESSLFAVLNLKEKKVKKYYYSGHIIGTGGDDEILLSDTKEISKEEYIQWSKKPEIINTVNNIVAYQSQDLIGLLNRGWNLGSNTTKESILKDAKRQIKIINSTIMQKASQLQIGTKIESEHKETFQFIRQYLKDHGKLPPEKEVYKHIAKNHLEEFKKYYIALIEMEKKLRTEEMKKAFFSFMLKGEHKGPHKYIRKTADGKYIYKEKENSENHHSNGSYLENKKIPKVGENVFFLKGQFGENVDRGIIDTVTNIDNKGLANTYLNIKDKDGNNHHINIAQVYDHEPKKVEIEDQYGKTKMWKANFFSMLKGEHKGPHKYYKKIPKSTGKGWLYFYTKDQYDQYAKKEKKNEDEESTAFNVLSIIKNLFGLQTESEAKNKIKEDYKSKEIEKKYNISLQDYANHIREYFMNKDIWTAFVDQSKLPGDAQKSKISIPVKIGIIKELHGEYKNLSPVEKQEIQKSKFHVRLTSSNGQTKIKDFDTLDEAQQWADNKVRQLQQNIKDRKAHVISDVTLFNDEVSSSDGIKLFDIDEYVTKENNFDTMPESEPVKETIQQKFERWKSGNFEGLLGTVFTLIQELTDLKTSSMHVDKVIIDGIGDFISYKFEGQPSWAGGGSINKNSFIKMLANGTAIPAEMEKTIESGNGSKIESGKKPSEEEKKQIADEIQETAREGYYNEKPSEILNVGKDVWGARRHNFDTYERTNVDLQQLEKDGTALAYVTKKNLLGDYGLANKDERVKNGETEYKVLASYAIKEYLEKIPSNNELSRQKYADFCRAIIRLDQDTTTAKDFCYGLSEIFTTLFGSEKKQTNPDGSIDILNLVKPSDYKIIKETIGGPLTVFMKSLSGNASTYDIYDLDGKREQKQFDVLSRIILAESKKGNDDYNSIYTKIFGKTKVSGIQIKKGDAIELTDELKKKIRLVKKSFSSDEQKQIYLAISKKMQNLYEYDIKFDYFENPGNKEILEKEFGQKFNSKEEAKNYFNSEMKSLKEELSKHIVIDYIYPTSAGQVVRAGRNTIDVAFTFPDGQVRAWEMRPEDIKPENIQSAEKQLKEKSNYKFDLYFESQAERKGGKNYDSINAKEAQKILEDKYMFKAVQYGNSMPDTERIYHTKKSLEAFSDLSEILNIPIQQVTVNGKLGIAFGARGHDPFGRSGGVAAHYERGSKMINLTRSNGFGSLAHEWGHFLDNILTNDMQHYMSTHPDYIDKKVSSKDEIKHGSIYERVARKKVVRYFFDANAPNARYPFVQLEEGQIEPGKDAKRIGLYSYNITVQEPVEGSRMKQLAQDIANVSRESLREQTKQAMENFQPGSLQYEIYQALILDNDYLNRKNECFARAFEAYIGDKLENNGRKNTYLSSQKKTLEKDGGTIYPQKEYRKTINDLFEQFFNEVRNSGELKKAIDLLEKNQIIKWFNPDTHQFEYIRKK